MWSAHQKKIDRLGIILRPSSIQHSYHGQRQGRQLSPPSRCWSRRSSQLIRIPMNPQFCAVLAVNIQLCHPASMSPTCRPTHSVCWLLWPWFEWMKSTAPNHWSHPSRLQFRRPQWMWIPLKARRQHTQQRTMPHFILTMSPDNSIGIILQATPLIPRIQEIFCRFEPFLQTAASTKTKKEAEHGDVFCQKRGSAAAHLRGMRPAPTSQKYTLMFSTNSNITYF